MPFKDLREQEKENRRNFIVDAAEKLFFSHGYDKVSMDDIAREVGLNKATIYFYFKSKDSLYLAIVLRAVRLLNQMVRDATGNARSGIQKIDAVGNAYTGFYSARPDYYRAYKYYQAGMFEGLKGADAGGEVRDDLEEIDRHLIDIYEAACAAAKDAMADGALGADMDPLDVALMMIATSENVLGMGPGLKIMLEKRKISNLEYMFRIRNFLHSLIRSK